MIRPIAATLTVGLCSCTGFYGQLVESKNDWCAFTAWHKDEIPIRVFSAERSYDVVMREAAAMWSPYIVVSAKRPQAFVRHWDVEDMALTTTKFEGCYYKDAQIDLPLAPSLRTVAHEFGHLLGLRHDEDRQSVMYPFVDDQVEPFRIEPRDFRILEEIYGPNAEP